jgi:hypothetical protein
VDIQAEGGFAFREGDGPWKQDGLGRGPLFKDPYPLSDSRFLVSHKPAGPAWNDPRGYSLHLLDEKGGVVPVEDDGSASFLVRADANIFFQALDANYMAVQTERTFVDYRPGEVRSCIGCHETPGSVSTTDAPRTLKAVHRPPSVPGPQPGETCGQRPLDYAADVQPVWDRHCVTCHGGPEARGELDLSGTLTERFNVSYENLIPERRRDPYRDRDLLGPVIGENHPKTGNVEYLPARSLGSHASALVAMLNPDTVTLQDPEQAERARKLAGVHKDIRLTTGERIRVTNWIDTNGQYYGSYWGRRHLQHKDHPDFRPAPTFESARSMVPPDTAMQSGK